jgi:hypothetical protein
VLQQLAVDPLTPEFFESLGRLAFEFAALEQMVGLCILELDLSQDRDTIWRDSFEKKLGKLKKDLVTNVESIPNCTVKIAVLDHLLNKAIAVARKRNTVIHGVLQVHPVGNVLLKNLAFGSTHPVGSVAMDELRIEVVRLYDQFVAVRSTCIETRLLAGAHWA